MSKVQINTGDKFGYWEVLKPQVGKQNRKTLCLCLGCSKVQREIYSDQLRIGRSTSCGCQRQVKNRITKDNNNQLLKAGDKFGYWQVVEKIGSKSLVTCTGCNEVSRQVKNDTLLRGQSKSCGCKRLELDLKQKSKHYAYNKANVKIGDVINDWKVLEFVNHNLKCLCLSCNVETRIARYSEIKSGRRVSCGCATKYPPRSKKIIVKREKLKKKSKLVFKGSRFGYWEVLEDPSEGKALCVCRGCNITQKYHQLQILVRRSKSCGCMQQELSQATNLEKYGVVNAAQYDSFKSKRISTTKERYGHESPMQSDIVKNKQRNTMLEKYGAAYSLQIPSLRLKVKESFLAKGKVWAPPTKELKLLQNGVALSDYCESHKVPPTRAYQIFNRSGEGAFKQYCQNYKLKVSSLELELLSMVKDISISSERYNKSVPFAGYKPDLKLQNGDKVLFINADGLFFHSLARQEDKKYHHTMSDVFEKNNQRIMQFRSNEIINKKDIVKSIIKNYFGLGKKYHARTLQVQKVDSIIAEQFLNENHLMGSNKFSKSYGLYKDEELLAVMSVSKRDKTLIIDRFCTKIETSVRGAFSKLLRFYEKLYLNQIEEIVSFCDRRYSTGNSYILANFKKEGCTLGWQWTNGQRVFNRLQCRANMDDRKLTQAEYAKELGWYKIYDAGQAKYIKKIEKGG